MPDEPKTRLDRELEEILQKKAREPVPFSSHPRAPKRKGQVAFQNASEIARDMWSFLTSAPLLLAFVFAIAAKMVSGVSPLLALLLAVGTVASLWLPGFIRMGQPSDAGKPEIKYWRGKAYTSSAKDLASRHPIDSLKRHFDRHR